MLRSGSSLLGIAAVTLWAGAASAWTPAEPEHDYWDPLVVTPAGQPSRASEAPSTTFVITADEIRRSGATSIPEILRRVPGLDVRLMTATDGQLGLRGFAYEIGDRVLVLVDGRTAYIDFWGGTAFEMLPVSLVDIEQIEVVLGPGSSIYGNKAMLGTVNIVTRSAADYPSTEARLDAGPPGEGRVALRHGAIRGNWRLRATGLGRRLTPFEPAGRNPGSAGGGTLSATYSPSAATEAALEIGGMYGETYIIPTASHVDRFDGALGYLRAQGRQGLGGAGSPYGALHLDLVWNAGSVRSNTFPLAEDPFRTTFHTPYARLHHELRTRVLDVPVQGRWGGEVRLNTLESSITTGERPVWNVAGFASTELLLGDSWRLTTGLRVDRSTLTDASIVSPRVSVVWSPVERHQLRASFNTGYNNAQLLNYFADFPLRGLHVQGNLDLHAERAVYGALGWNGQLTRELRAFATTFAYRFSDWISLDPRKVTESGIPYGNNDSLRVYGSEVGAELSLRRTLSAYASYAFIGPRGGEDSPYRFDAHGSPQHKVGAGIRAEHRTGTYLSVDAQYVGPAKIARVTEASTPQQPFQPTTLDAYVVSHARLGYASPSGLDVSVAGYNALDDRTLEFPGAERPERRVMATIAYYR